MQKSLFITRYLSTLLSKPISGVAIIGASPTPVLYEPNPSQSQSTAEVPVTLRSWSRMVQIDMFSEHLANATGNLSLMLQLLQLKRFRQTKRSYHPLAGPLTQYSSQHPRFAVFRFSSEQGAYRVIPHLRGERRNWRLRVFMQSRISK